MHGTSQLVVHKVIINQYTVAQNDVFTLCSQSVVLPNITRKYSAHDLHTQHSRFSFHGTGITLLHSAKVFEKEKLNLGSTDALINRKGGSQYS